MIVGLLVSAKQEVATAKSYSDSSEVRLLANMTGDLVISQLAQATNQNPHNTLHDDWAWISQPGLLRTFSPDGQQAAYKLYSSYNMIESASYDPNGALSAEIPNDWYSQTTHPNEFVDLNQPVTLPLPGISDNMVYPIVDPAAVPPTGTYPNAPSGVEGFSLNTAQVGNLVAPTSVSNPVSNPLPMPVRWIYVTPDGRFLKATDVDKASGNDYKLATARIAFWADDETCKVNLNTASGGVFFDRPSLNNIEDNMIARTQPIAQEYQRWPGHPATTSLVPLFPQLRGISDPVKLSQLTAALTPRIGPGGSNGGSLYAWITNGTLTATSTFGTQIFLDSDRLLASFDELEYGSPSNSVGVALNGAQRAYSQVLGSGDSSNGLATQMGGFKLTGGLTVSKQIDQLRFFATVHSKAPELNLFNRPRVSMWPFNYEMINNTAPGYSTYSKNLTPEDKLLQFSSELGGVNTDPNTGAVSLQYPARKRFYFQREDAWNSAVDWTIPENQALFTYLQLLTSKPVPGATIRTGGSGKTLESKFGTNDRDTILAEMWDYIRSQVNNVNQAYAPVGLLPYTFPANINVGSNGGGTGDEVSGFGDVAPILVKGTNTTVKGLGRYPVPAEILFVFYNCAAPVGTFTYTDTTVTPNVTKTITFPAEQFEKNSDGSYTDADNDQIPDYIIRKVRMVMLIHFMMPINHTMGSLPRFQVQVTGSPFGLSITPTGNNTGVQALRREGEDQTQWRPQIGDIGFPSTDRNGGINYVDPIQIVDGFAMGGSMGLGLGLNAPTTAATNQQILSVSSRGKVLSNRATLNPGSPADLLASAAIGSRFAGNTARCDIYYPFCSDVIEFRLPNNSVTTVAHGQQIPPPYSGATQPLVLPSVDPKNPVPVDFFNNVTMIGGQLNITIYPGLISGQNDPSRVTSWVKPDSTDGAGNYLFKTSLSIQDAPMPLPRLGPQWLPGLAPAPNTIPGVNSFARVAGMPSAVGYRGLDGQAHIEDTFAGMADFCVRTNEGGDEMVNVPRGAVNSNDNNNNPPIPAVNAQQMDVVRSYILAGDGQSNPNSTYGDIRVVAARRDIPAAWYQPANPLYFNKNSFNASAYVFSNQVGAANPAPGEDLEFWPIKMYPAPSTTRTGAYYQNYPFVAHLGVTTSPSTEVYTNWGSITPSRAMSYGTGIAARAVTGGAISPTQPGDFSFGYGDGAVGGVAVGPDTGSGAAYLMVNAAAALANSGGNYWSPYYALDGSGNIRSTYGIYSPNGTMSMIGNAGSGNGTDNWHRNVSGILFSPFKQSPSPVIFGSLPSRAWLTSGAQGKDDPAGPWETLLFDPNPEGGSSSHRGWTELPRDHYWLDLFYMPVVEPYAITDDFATAGKINLNYQIAPFTYIQRKTGLYALMDDMSVRWGPGQRPNFTTVKDQGSAIIGIPAASGVLSTSVRAGGSKIGDAGLLSYRYYVDVPSTVDLFDARFNNNDPFVSPSEICEMYLLPSPQGPNYTKSSYNASTIESVFWKNCTLTGDDQRESPYNRLYPRVTTRSNTFRVHFWVQTLNPKGLSAQGTPTNAAPIVTGEYRGSMLVERYLDPNLATYGTGNGSGTGVSVDGPNATYPFMNTYYKYRKIELRQFSP